MNRYSSPAKSFRIRLSVKRPEREGKMKAARQNFQKQENSIVAQKGRRLDNGALFPDITPEIPATGQLKKNR
jgi:hypothetical protein